MKKKITTIAALFSLTIVLSSCSEAPQGDAQNTQSSDYMACMISDSGGFEDQSFNQSGYEGLLKAKNQLGVGINALESNSSTEYSPNIELAIKNKCSIIFAIGFFLSDAARQAAEKNPNSNIVIIDDGQPSTLPNLKTVVYDTTQPAFLAGYLAASISETKTVGTLGGADIPAVNAFMDGFARGVSRYNESHESEPVKVLGWDYSQNKGVFSGDFESQDKVKLLTQNLLAENADVIMPVSGQASKGSVVAFQDHIAKLDATSNKPKLIWTDTDGYENVPGGKDFIVTSVMKMISASVFDIIGNNFANKEVFDPTPYFGTLANRGADLSPIRGLESEKFADILLKIDNLREEIIAGKIKVNSPFSPK